MKIGLFSDPHYCKADDLGLNRRPILSLDKIKAAMVDFKEQGVELCICLGDLIDHRAGDTKKDILDNLNEVLALIRSFDIPFYLVPGNHDFADLSRKDWRDALVNFPDPVCDFEAGGRKFILLDANFRTSTNHFDTEGHLWDDANLIPPQLEYLEKVLKGQKNCIVLVHENLDSTVDGNHIIKNACDVRKIIEDSGAVDMVIQGHYHYGSNWQNGNVCYHTLEAMCLGEENHYEIIEL